MKYLKKTDLTFENYAKEFDEVIQGAKYLHTLCSGMVWTEGPVVLKDDVIFSDVKSNKMYRYSIAQGSVEVFREYSNYANGNYIDKEGRLITCEHGRRCISRTELDGSVKILVDFFEGKRFNSPNDVVVKSDGSIWFTDPPYGIISNEEGYKAESQIIGCYVYRFNPETKELKAMITDTQRPNGLAFSPCESKLYVADMSVVDFPLTGRRHIRVYDLENNDEVINGKNLAKIEPGIPDGFRVDNSGRLFVSCEDGLQVLKADGQCIGKIFIPERVSNCVFGSGILFVTASSSLYGIKINK